MQAAFSRWTLRTGTVPTGTPVRTSVEREGDEGESLQSELGWVLLGGNRKGKGLLG